MVIYQCINCGDFFGAEEGIADRERGAMITQVSHGLCPYCHALHRDTRRYEQLGIPMIANYLSAVFKARNGRR